MYVIWNPDIVFEILPRYLFYNQQDGTNEGNSTSNREIVI